MFLKGTQIYPSPLWYPITLQGCRRKQVWSLLSSLISFSILPSPLSCLLGLAKWILLLGLVKCIPTLWLLHLQHVLPGGNFLLFWPKMSFLAQCLSLLYAKPNIYIVNNYPFICLFMAYLTTLEYQLQQGRVCSPLLLFG